MAEECITLSSDDEDEANGASSEDSTGKRDANVPVSVESVGTPPPAKKQRCEIEGNNLDGLISSNLLSVPEVSEEKEPVMTPETGTYK